MSGFPGCKWCYGRGCLSCDTERAKWVERVSQPIFTADPNDPEDMEALKRVFGAEALDKAFANGLKEGVDTIHYRAAVESLRQALRRHEAADPRAEPASQTPAPEPLVGKWERHAVQQRLI